MGPIQVLVLFMAILFIISLGLVFSFIKQNSKEKKIKLSLIEGLSLEEEYLLKKQNKSSLKKVKRKKNFPFKAMYNEYIFFGGTFPFFLKTFLIGVCISYLIYFLVTKDFVLSFIFSLFYFLVYYIVLSRWVRKKRLNYLRSFSSALEFISSSLSAGNTLEVSFSQLQKKEGTLSPKIIREFTMVSNALQTNSSLEMALDDFWKRNNIFQEFSMFVIALQFFAKNGGKNMKSMLSKMKESINLKIENYSIIDSKISMYKTISYVFLFILIGVSLLVGFFDPDFYIALQSPIGYAKALGSVFFGFLGVYLMNNMIKTAAEA